MARGQPLQHPPRGRVVEGRYLPLHPAAREGASSGQSRTPGAPGGRGRGRSFKGWGRRERGLTGKRRVVDPTVLNRTFPPPGVSPRRRELFPADPEEGPDQEVPHPHSRLRKNRSLWMISLFVTGLKLKPVAPQPCFIYYFPNPRRRRKGLPQYINNNVMNISTTTL